MQQIQNFHYSFYIRQVQIIFTNYDKLWLCIFEESTEQKDKWWILSCSSIHFNSKVVKRQQGKSFSSLSHGQSGIYTHTDIKRNLSLLSGGALLASKHILMNTSS